MPRTGFELRARRSIRHGIFPFRLCRKRNVLHLGFALPSFLSTVALQFMLDGPVFLGMRLDRISDPVGLLYERVDLPVELSVQSVDDDVLHLDRRSVEILSDLAEMLVYLNRERADEDERRDEYDQKKTLIPFLCAHITSLVERPGRYDTTILSRGNRWNGIPRRVSLDDAAGQE